jgi:hypothetical protein
VSRRFDSWDARRARDEEREPAHLHRRNAPRNPTEAREASHEKLSTLFGRHFIDSTEGES